MSRDEETTEALPDLTDQQMAFALGYVVNGGDASAAYRAAYNAENMLPRTIWRKAAEVKSNGKVSAWIAHLKKAGAKRAKLTVEEFISETVALAQEAKEKGNYGAAAKCLEMAGRASGALDETKHIHHHSASEADLKEEIASLQAEIAAEQKAAERIIH